MKRKLLIAVGFLLTQLCSAQVLFTENFENYTIGNMFPISSNFPPISGQGGWVANYSINQSSVNKTLVSQELNRGKVLTLTTTDLPTVKAYNTISRPNISNAFNQRKAGNNVLKLEVDYYTGEQQNEGIPPPYGSVQQSLGLIFDENPADASFTSRYLLLAIYNSKDLTFRFRYNNKTSPFDIWVGKLPYKTWITYIVYLDYNNHKIYYEIPYINAVGSGDHFLYHINSPNLIEDYKPLRLNISFDAAEGSNIPLTNKYDNIKITALQSVPQHILSAESFLDQKFNLYPNPATNVVTITNSENLLVQQIAVYDTAGKLIKT